MHEHYLPLEAWCVVCACTASCTTDQAWTGAGMPFNLCCTFLDRPHSTFLYSCNTSTLMLVNGVSYQVCVYSSRHIQ